MTVPSVVLVRSEIVVLVVWDEPYGLQLINAALSPAEFRVYLAASGMEAVSLYQRHQEEIDLVLVNLTLLPPMSGPATFEALRQVNPSVRCAFMTAHAPCVVEDMMTEDQRRVVVGWLWKPFNVDELIGGVREWSLR